MPEYGEHINQPADLDELMRGFGRIAILDGVLNRKPLDPSLEPGNDGSLRPDNLPAYGYDYTIPFDHLPQGVRNMGVHEITIETFTSAVVAGSVIPERTWVKVQEMSGNSWDVVFLRISNNLIIPIFSKDADTHASRATGDELGSHVKNAILTDLFAGRGDWLERSDPAGDFARHAHQTVSVYGGQKEAHNVDKLRSIYSELPITELPE